MKLLKRDKEKLIAWLKTGQNGNTEVYWDYSHQLSENQIEEILQGNANDVENSIFDDNIDHIFDLERTIVNNAMEAIGLDTDDYDMADVRDSLIDYIEVDLNFKQLLKNTGKIPVRITLYSNYDCINSHWFEQSGGGYGYVQSYFGAMVNALKLNPRKVKEKFISHGDKMHGLWPNKPERDGKEYVDYGQFFVEMENQSCAACNLIVVGMIDLQDLMKGKPEIIVIPKRNCVGMYSSMNGGGSPIEAPLLRDMKINLSKAYPTEWDHWRLDTDTRGNGYTIDNAYGVTKEFWGKEIQVLTYKKEKNEQAILQS